MAFNLSLDQIIKLMTIEQRGTNYYIQLRGGQTINGKNFFYLAKQIKERFDLEVTALQLKTIFHKNKS
jgi:hypothetical protein